MENVLPRVVVLVAVSILALAAARLFLDDLNQSPQRLSRLNSVEVTILAPATDLGLPPPIPRLKFASPRAAKSSDAKR